MQRELDDASSTDHNVEGWERFKSSQTRILQHHSGRIRKDLEAQSYLSGMLI